MAQTNLSLPVPRPDATFLLAMNRSRTRPVFPRRDRPPHESPLVRRMGAAEEGSVGFNAVPDHFAPAMSARWSQRMNRHSKLSKVCERPCTVTWNALSYSLPQVSHCATAWSSLSKVALCQKTGATHMPKVPLIESHAWLANSYANAAARVTASERMEDLLRAQT